MYVVTVEFHIHSPHLAAFLPQMNKNAQASLRSEPGCRQFDVCTDPARPSSEFLYEVYDDRSACEAHLASEHFTRFDAAVRDMVAGKFVRTLQRVESTEPKRPTPPRLTDALTGPCQLRAGGPSRSSSVLVPRRAAP